MRNYSSSTILQKEQFLWISDQFLLISDTSSDNFLQKRTSKYSLLVHLHSTTVVPSLCNNWFQENTIAGPRYWDVEKLKQNSQNALLNDKRFKKQTKKNLK